MRFWEKAEACDPSPLCPQVAARAGSCFRDAMRRSRMMPTNLLCTSPRWTTKSCTWKPAQNEEYLAWMALTPVASQGRTAIVSNCSPFSGQQGDVEQARKARSKFAQDLPHLLFCQCCSVNCPLSCAAKASHSVRHKECMQPINSAKLKWAMCPSVLSIRSLSSGNMQRIWGYHEHGIVCTVRVSLERGTSRVSQAPQDTLIRWCTCSRRLNSGVSRAR